MAKSHVVISFLVGMNDLNLYVKLLFVEQLRYWPLAEKNYQALSEIETSRMLVRGRVTKLQFNPERIHSSAANIDADSLKNRPCFLCKENQPKEQRRLPYKDKYEIGVNPYPIFLRHLTISSIHHAVAKHSNERMSQQLLAQYGAAIVGEALNTKSVAIQQLGNTVYGLGAQYGVTLPFSRKHESEADYMGLVFMAMAGYNPDVALNFWQKMSSGNANKVPEFMGTHPSDATRIADIRRHLPEVEKYRKITMAK